MCQEHTDRPLFDQIYRDALRRFLAHAAARSDPASSDPGRVIT